MLFLGCDPDMHTMPFAWVDETLQIVHIELFGDNGPSKEQVAILAMVKALDAYRTFVGTKAIDYSLQRDTLAYAVEAQEIYPTGPNKTKNPRNILHLGTVAGAALGLCASFSGTGYFPLPTQWKGQVDKLAHHQRILKAAGITGFDVMGGKEPYCVPHDRRGYNKGDWKHIMDAIGLAQYAAQRYLAEQTKQKYLSLARKGNP